jgi:hypothetical protein
VDRHFGMLLFDDVMHFTKSIRPCFALLLLLKHRNCDRLWRKGSQTSNCVAVIEFFALGYTESGQSTVASRGNFQKKFPLTPKCKTGESSNSTLPPHKNL